MKCPDFRLAAEDRPAGAASFSPRLRDHLDGCPPCQHWDEERARWGDLGRIFRQEPPSSDLLFLRGRVRACISTQPRAWSLWPRAAFGTLAAGILVGVGVYVLLPDRPAETRLADLGAVKEENSVSSWPDKPPAPARQEGAAPMQIRKPGPPRVGESPAARGRDMGRSSTVLHPVASAPGEPVQITRVGKEVALQWPSNGDRVHRILKSHDPSDFSNGELMLVKGDRWIDSSSETMTASVVYYSID